MERRDFIRLASLSVAVWGLPTWKAKAAEVDGVRFGLLTDLHYANRNPRGQRIYRDSSEKAADFVTLCNSLNLDFIIETGDFKDAGTDEAQTLGFLRTIEGVLQGFNGPTYHVLGNHDMDVISKPQFLANITNTGIDPEASYYSFDAKGVHFVVLDANFQSDGTDYDHGKFDWKDANIPQAQLDWLAADLASAQGPTIVFCHQLLFGVDRLNVLIVNNAPAVRKVLEDSGKVVAVVTGHHHAGAYEQLNGIHYYTQKAMVEGPYPTNNAFSIVEVTPGKITIDGYVNVEDSELTIPRFPG